MVVEGGSEGASEGAREGEGRERGERENEREGTQMRVLNVSVDSKKGLKWDTLTKANQFFNKIFNQIL